MNAGRGRRIGPCLAAAFAAWALFATLCVPAAVAQATAPSAGRTDTAATDTSEAEVAIPRSKYKIQFVRYPAGVAVPQLIVNQAIYVSNFGDRDGVMPGSIFQVFGRGQYVGLLRVERTFRDSSYLRMVNLERKVNADDLTVVQRYYELFPKYVLLESVNFGSGKPDFTVEMHERLRYAARFILSFPDYPLLLEGHTDNTGKKSENVKLAIRRAESIKDYLHDIQRVPRTQMYPVGYADERPLASNSTEQGRFTNRRVDIVLVDELPPEAVPGGSRAPGGADTQ